MVFESFQRNAPLCQQTPHPVVPGQGGGLVVVVGVHGLDTQLHGQSGDFFAAAAMADDQPGIGMAGQRPQFGIERLQRFMNELNPPVFAWQISQDVGVKDKGGVDLFALSQGVIKGSLVVGAQIAPEPDQPAGEHGGRGGIHRGLK